MIHESTGQRPSRPSQSRQPPSRQQPSRHQSQPRPSQIFNALNLKTPITLAVLLLILLVGAWWGWQLLVSPGKGTDAAPDTPCQTVAEPGLLEAPQVRVNVLNAGSRGGLAGETAELLTQRGFQAVSGNAQPGTAVTTVQVVGIAPDHPAVLMVRAQINGAAETIGDGRQTGAVDVILGDGFEGLAEGAPLTIDVPAGTVLCE